MTEHENIPSPTSETLPSQTNDQLSELAKECLAKIEEYKSGPRLPSGRRSASLRSLSFYSKHASRPTSPTPKLMHPSSPTQTLSMPQMQQYDELNESDTEGGPLNRSKRSRTERV